MKNAEELAADSNVSLPTLDTWEVFSIDTYLPAERVKILNLERAARAKVLQHVRLLEKVIVGINKVKKEKDFVKL